MLFSKNRTRSSIYRKIYEQHYGKIPKDKDGRTYEIHHLDGDHNNNNPSNLKAVTIQEHYDIHYGQGDWAACLAISGRMNISPEKKSELARLNVMKQIEDGTHPLTSENAQKWQTKLVESGKHHFLKRADGSSVTSDRYADGTHPFLHIDRRGEKHPMYKHEIYHFENIITGEIAHMTQKNFIDNYNLDFRNVSAIVRGKRRIHKGWIFKGPVNDLNAPYHS
jgi:hypothetical protein